jgi:hypothetical protein
LARRSDGRHEGPRAVPEGHCGRDAGEGASDQPRDHPFQSCIEWPRAPRSCRLRRLSELLASGRSCGGGAAGAAWRDRITRVPRPLLASSWAVLATLAREEHIATCGALVALVGPSGIGEWQHREIQLGISRQASIAKAGRAFPVIPVLLPGLANDAIPICSFSWKRDPATGLIFIQSGPRRVGCHSAWGPNADRRGNSLNCQIEEGSNSEAASQWTKA